MRSLLPSQLRPALLVIGAVLLGSVPLAAQAQEGMRVARDPETGLLRMPTAEEIRVLEASRPQPGANARSLAPGALTAGPQKRVLPHGGVAVDLDESTMMYSVARRNADGSIDRYCVDGKDNADKILNAPQNFTREITGATAKKGARYETE